MYDVCRCRGVHCITVLRQTGCYVGCRGVHGRSVAMYTVTGCLCHNVCGVEMSVTTTMTTMTSDENEHDDKTAHHPFPHRPSILTHSKSPSHASRSKIRSF